MDNDLSYCELRRREVINGVDGRRLGHIIDIVFSSESGKIRGIILPYGKRGLFQKSQDLFVPWQCVQKIGEDVILVEIVDLPSGAPTCIPSKSTTADRAVTVRTARRLLRRLRRRMRSATATASAKSACCSTVRAAGARRDK